MTRKQLKMNRQFKRKNLIAILGCGSTPGITNVMAAHGARFFDSIDEIHVSFADADFTKYNQPFIIPYTMYTLFDEFMLKPALYTKGKLKMVKPISGEKILEFPKLVGKITGFYTLHSELATFPSSFKDKGIKECSFRVTFPKDFIDKIRFLIDIGFASEKEIKINSIELKPKDFTAKVMNQWLPKPGTKIKDLEYLRVEIIGIKNKKQLRKILYCFNKSYKNFPAGSYNTGVTPSIVAQMIAKGEIKKKGVLAPELCIDPESFFKELEKRKIKTIDGIYENKNNKNLRF